MADDSTPDIDAKTLWLDGEAAREVGNHFKTLAGKLEKLKSKFAEFDGDLGMGNCNEGHSWNTLMADGRQSVMDQFAHYIAKANDFAAKAETAQVTIDQGDKRSASQFEQVNGRNAYPSYLPE